MTRRHPHVFAGATVEDADAQTAAWEAHKEKERAQKAREEGREPSVLDGVALSYPALMRSVKLAKRAARPQGWEDVECVLYGRTTIKTVKTFLADQFSRTVPGRRLPPEIRKLLNRLLRVTV